MRRLCAVYRNIVDKRGPISRIYYTESDQIVRIEERYVEPLLRASNRSTIFMGHRKQKDPQTDPQLHMEGLKQTRATCGRRGFFLSAKDFQVRDSLNLPVENTSIASHESSPLAPNMKLRGAIMWKKQQAEAISLMKQSFRESE